MVKQCNACGEGKCYFRSGFSASEGGDNLRASTVFDRYSMGHTLAEPS
jgi:hypothetical protein